MHDIKLAENLLCEVMQIHKDPESPDYNECDKEPCYWCELAMKAMYGTPTHKPKPRKNTENANTE